MDTVEYLLAHGADANAVAAADAMPLTLAEALTPSSDKDEIIDLLLRKYVPFCPIFLSPFCRLSHLITTITVLASCFRCDTTEEQRTHGARIPLIVHRYPKQCSNPFREAVLQGVQY